MQDLNSIRTAIENNTDIMERMERTMRSMARTLSAQNQAINVLIEMLKQMEDARNPG